MAWTTGSTFKPPQDLTPRPRAVFPFGAPQPVSTETPLLALTELGVQYVDLVFTLRNHDVTNRAAFYIDRSESGVAVDDARQIVYVSPGKEWPVEFRGILRRMWAISAAGDPDAGFPTVNVSWQLVGRFRPP